MEETSEENEQEAFWVQEELDDHTLEVLAAEDDEDAAVLQFEDSISAPSRMTARYTTYEEARTRLVFVVSGQ